FPGCPHWDVLTRRLNGEELIDKHSKQPVAMLQPIAKSDIGVIRYTKSARTWSTITPVILPGHDDPGGLRKRLREGVKAEEQKRLLQALDVSILKLLWKAFEQAGFSPEVLEGAGLEYRKVGWWPRLGMAPEYVLPQCKYARLHVRVQFKQEVTGPLVIGAGRYRGFGLFAAEE
ncbi:MAG: type I-G CRISPR-associated protein Csb2, partial [Gemmataceae bacterium]